MPNTLKSQVVLILGASSGIGQATAIMATNTGATVIAAARREERLLEMQTRLRTDGVALAIGKADGDNLDDVTALVTGVIAEHGRIDIAVYACGTNSPERAMKVMPPATWNHILQTTLTGAFYFSHALLPHMR